MIIPFGIYIVKLILRSTFPNEAYYMIVDRSRLKMANASGKSRVTMSAMPCLRFMLLNVRG
jgi:hypothetical protein